MIKKDIFGIIHPASDIHTLGISYVQQLLEDCGITVVVADGKIIDAANHIAKPSNFQIIKKWIIRNKITYLGFSYRLDPQQALELFSRMIYQIDQDSELVLSKGRHLKDIFFAGLPLSCQLVKNRFEKRFKTFIGDETPFETLTRFGISKDQIPKTIHESSVYDDLRLEFGKQLISREKHLSIHPYPRLNYKDYGTKHDNLIKRLHHAQAKNYLPLIRVHSGPFLKEREKAVLLFMEWLKKLSTDGFLDIMSIGSSQLTQSNFGENWEDMPNGGGVPINNEKEFHLLWEVSRPMLLRAYSGTKNVKKVAEVLEKSINIAWHALSFWWFNKIDGRGPLDLKSCLKEHCETLKYIAFTNKPFEPNVPHHFAFRGSDDLTYIISTYIAVKTAKMYGIKFLVLQNMLNTPKSTFGINDLAKSRAILALVKSLVSKDFKIFYQPRAGLDYFSPDFEKAKIQLASVSALMIDVRPEKLPEIIHVVSYSEASHLADPDIINESIKITRAALNEYPKYKKKFGLDDIVESPEILEKTEKLIREAKQVIAHIEKWIKYPYTPKGLYNIYKSGYFPTPYIYNCREEFNNAVNWNTKVINGGLKIVDKLNRVISTTERLEIIEGMKKIKNNVLSI